MNLEPPLQAELDPAQHERKSMSSDRNKGIVAPVALVTGGNAGIGFETCKGLLAAGVQMVVTGWLRK